MHLPITFRRPQPRRWVIVVLAAGAIATGFAGVWATGRSGVLADSPPTSAPDLAAIRGADDIVAERQFSEEEARRRATELMEAMVSESIGRDQPGSEDQAGSRALLIDGRPILLSDLGLKEVRFEPAAVRVEASNGAFAGFNNPTDAWVFLWERENVPAPEWDGKLVTVAVFLVLRDGEGTPSAMQIGYHDPAAMALEPPN